MEYMLPSIKAHVVDQETPLMTMWSSLHPSFDRFSTSLGNHHGVALQGLSSATRIQTPSQGEFVAICTEANQLAPFRSGVWYWAPVALFLKKIESGSGRSTAKGRVGTCPDACICRGAHRMDQTSKPLTLIPFRPKLYACEITSLVWSSVAGPFTRLHRFYGHFELTRNQFPTKVLDGSL